MSDASAIAQNLASVRERIAAAAHRAGRDADDITLVGASKTVPAERIAEALAAGLADLGENRAQELLAKAPALATGSHQPTWHFIGALQRNKVKALAPWVQHWHSVDRPQLGATIATHAPGARVFVEVNLGGEASKAGCAPSDVPELVDRLLQHGLVVEGLMTVPPDDAEPRRWFGALADLASRVGVRELSMGMTQDFEVAIEEGATVVRVGRAIFGSRPP